MRGKTFRYLYDFGDGWEHSVKIESIAPAEPQISYPRLLDANGMRPPEDSGGPWGYAETLEALSDPTHEYHEQALDILAMVSEALADAFAAPTGRSVAAMVAFVTFTALAPTSASATSMAAPITSVALA